MGRTLIIGIGNPLRGDDGIGWRAVESLRPRLPAEGVETIVCHQLTPELAETVARCERVIFVDACVGQPPGTIRLNRLTPDLPADSALTHSLDPQGLMRYSRKLYGSWPEAMTISMTGADYNYGEALSPAVEAQLPALVALLSQMALQTGEPSQERTEVYADA